MRNLRRWWWLLLLVLVAVLIGTLVLGGGAASPMDEALAALETNDQVVVTQDRWLVFTPSVQEATTGLIIYPGARVAPEAYSPAAREIAAQGYLVVIVPMPLDLAILGSGRAAAVVAAHPVVQRWAIGGHSLGGVMGARYVLRNPEQIDGLVLWASYPAEGDDLSGSDLEVVSIYGSLDGLVTLEEIDGSRALLPAGTRWVEVEGGNHAQFGWYGEQGGDLPATISRPAQQEQVVEATVDLLRDLGSD